MKNKKLFAILTLVCFMFTLMPVAAFAAPYSAIDADYTAVKTGDPVKVTISETGNYYIYAVKDGELAKITSTSALNVNAGVTTGTEIGLSLVKVNVTDVTSPTAIAFAVAGEYTVNVAKADNTNLNNVIEGVNGLVPATTVLTNLNTFKVGALSSAVSVSAKTAVYEITAVTTDGSVSATNGYDKAYQTVKLTTTPGAVVVPGAELEIVTDSYAINVVKVDAKTKVNGELQFYVTGKIPGEYNVHVKHAAAVADLVIPVTVSPATVDAVTTVAQPTAPQDNTVDTDTANIVFQITDATGYAYKDTVAVNTDYKVSIIEAPKGVSKSTPLKLVYKDASTTQQVAGWEIVQSSDSQPFALDKEGVYTFQVSLVNGAKATASVTIDKFDKAVALKFVGAPTTVVYGKTANIAASMVYAVDANGVVKQVTPDSLTVNGKAVSTFVAPTLTAKNDEKYIGSKVTVLAVKGDLVATTELTVVDDAATIAYVNTEVAVGSNATLAGMVKDANGNVVTTGGSVQIIVLEKPANAVVTVNENNSGTVTNGKFSASFLASAAGEYKIQTIVTNGSEYISDFATITVGGGAGAFQDVIVMSIGANTMVKNSATVAMPAAPEIVDSRTMVPARAGLEAFGAVVAWDEATQTVTAELNGVKVVMTIGEKAYTVNGKVVTGDAAPYITAASTMVPVSFFTNAFGITATPIYDANGVCDVLFTK